MPGFVIAERESLTPERFLTLSNHEKKNIRRIRFIPPVIGKPGFGEFEVHYRTQKLNRWPD